MSDRLDEIKARLAAATPGPWERRTEEESDDDYPVSIVHRVQFGDFVAHPMNVLKVCTNDWPPSEPDAELIVHAPEDMGWLVAEVERQAAALNAVGVAVGFWDYAGKSASDSMRIIADIIENVSGAVTK